MRPLMREGLRHTTGICWTSATKRQAIDHEQNGH